MLSPTLDASLVTEQSRTAALREALLGLEPILASRGPLGSIEPTAGDHSSVRSHTDVVSVVQVSGVDRGHPFDDDQRVLPGPDDVSGAVRQVRDLLDAGATVPLSFECLSPTLPHDRTVHDDVAAAKELVAGSPAQR